MAKPRTSSVESLALWVGIASALIGFVVAVIALGGRSVPLGGSGSVAAIAIPVVAVTGAPSFIWAYVRHADGGVRWRLRHPARRFLDVLGLTLTGAGVAVLLIGSLFQVFQRAFVGLELNAFTSAAFIAGLAAASSYMLAIIAGHLTTSTLATLLGLFLVAGVFTSMLTANDPDWWHNNFSALGMGGAASSYAFNLTIVVAGLVLLTLADYLTIDLLTRRTPGGRTLRGVEVIRAALAIVGLALIGLGLVPVDVSVLAHNIFSTTAMLGFTALIVLTPVLLRGLSPAFIAATVLFLSLIIIGVVLFAVGYFNLTALELIAVVAIFTWLILFTRNASVGRVAEVVEETDEVDVAPRVRIRGALTVVGLVGAFLTGRFTR